eukprot:5872003-Ditylum_brightwellii.AAC.1
MLPQNTVKLRRAGIATTLEQSASDTAIRNLGVQITLTLQIQMELEHLKIKTRKFSLAITVCSLRQDEIWNVYFTIYIPSITYSFPAMTFIDEEHKQVNTILIPKLLPQLGFNRNTHCSVIFGPAKYMGLGLVHLKGLHLAMQVETIIKHIWNNEKIGESALIMFRWAQHTVGLEDSILKLTYHIPHLKGTWVNNFRDGLNTIKGTIELDNDWVRPC